jgi:hypothetical protein
MKEKLVLFSATGNNRPADEDIPKFFLNLKLHCCKHNSSTTGSNISQINPVRNRMSYSKTNFNCTASNIQVLLLSI